MCLRTATSERESSIMGTDNRQTNDARGMEGADPSEILELAKSQGIELTDGQLEEVVGGSFWEPHDVRTDGCPDCGGHEILYGNVGHIMWYTCKSCGKRWC